MKSPFEMTTKEMLYECYKNAKYTEILNCILIALGIITAGFFVCWENLFFAGMLTAQACQGIIEIPKCRKRTIIAKKEFEDCQIEQ